MGTRSHQLAMYVVYDSPLQIVADSPDAYVDNDATVPTSCPRARAGPACWRDRRIHRDGAATRQRVVHRRDDQRARAHPGIAADRQGARPTATHLVKRRCADGCAQRAQPSIPPATPTLGLVERGRRGGEVPPVDDTAKPRKKYRSRQAASGARGSSTPGALRSPRRGDPCAAARPLRQQDRGRRCHVETVDHAGAGDAPPSPPAHETGPLQLRDAVVAAPQPHQRHRVRTTLGHPRRRAGQRQVGSRGSSTATAPKCAALRQDRAQIVRIAHTIQPQQQLRPGRQITQPRGKTFVPRLASHQRPRLHGDCCRTGAPDRQPQPRGNPRGSPRNTPTPLSNGPCASAHRPGTACGSPWTFREHRADRVQAIQAQLDIAMLACGRGRLRGCRHRAPLRRVAPFRSRVGACRRSTTRRARLPGRTVVTHGHLPGEFRPPAFPASAPPPRASA